MHARVLSRRALLAAGWVAALDHGAALPLLVQRVDYGPIAKAFEAEVNAHRGEVGASGARLGSVLQALTGGDFRGLLAGDQACLGRARDSLAALHPPNGLRPKKGKSHAATLASINARQRAPREARRELTRPARKNALNLSAQALTARRDAAQQAKNDENSERALWTRELARAAQGKAASAAAAAAAPLAQPPPAALPLLPISRPTVATLFASLLLAPNPAQAPAPPPRLPPWTQSGPARSGSALPLIGACFFQATPTLLCAGGLPWCTGQRWRAWQRFPREALREGTP